MLSRRRNAVLCAVLTLPKHLVASCWFALIHLDPLFLTLPGLAAPPCVKMITNWFDPKERGFWWSVWHASINLGGFLCPFFAGGLAGHFGWRYGMLGPGFLGLVTVVLCYLAMSDGPKAAVKTGESVKGTTKPEPEVSLMDGIILNPVQWALGIAYMLVYVCRQGLSVWGIFYLMQTGALSPAKAAALFSGFELGGFLGNLTAGTLSDLLLQRARPGAGDVGQRAKAGCVGGCAAQARKK